MARIPEEQSREVRRAIIEATIHEIALHGYQGLRIGKVAERVGKTQGAVYGRFTDKEALALATLREFRDEKLAPLVFQASLPGKQPLDILDALSSIPVRMA